MMSSNIQNEQSFIMNKVQWNIQMNQSVIIVYVLFRLTFNFTRLKKIKYWDAFTIWDFTNATTNGNLKVITPIRWGGMVVIY